MLLNSSAFLSTTGFYRHTDVAGLCGINYLNSLWLLHIFQTVSAARRNIHRNWIYIVTSFIISKQIKQV